MSWFSTIVIAVITAALAAAGALLVAASAVHWYRVSSSGGVDGYFVLFSGFFGMLAGLLLGVVVSRLVAASAQPSAWLALGLSLGAVVVASAVAVGVMRWYADVAPTLAGEELLLQVEVRWPATQTSSPAIGAANHEIVLGALDDHTQRVRRSGPLWMEDARQEGGRWIVPGAVEIFTNRGQRSIGITPDIPGANGLLLPMSGSPGRADLTWTEWMPHPRPGQPPLPDGFSYRYKVLPTSQAVRTQRVGSFDIATIARGFYRANDMAGGTHLATAAGFEIRHRGQVVTIDLSADSRSNRDDTPEQARARAASAAKSSQRALAVAVLPGTPDALLVLVEAEGVVPTCWLLVDEGSRLRHSRVSHCEGGLEAEPLGNDPARRAASQHAKRVGGEIDRQTFADPGLHLFVEGILDVGRRSVRVTGFIDPGNGFNTSLPPLGLSPDGRSYVRLCNSQTTPGEPALLVYDLVAKSTSVLEFDLKGSRYPGDDQVNLAWLAKHFRWRQDSQGQDRLEAVGDAVAKP